MKRRSGWQDKSTATRRVLAALRFLLGGVALTAVGIHLGIHVRHGYSVLNFFSYFTNRGNIFAAVALLVESVLGYAYSFLNPANGGYGAVALTCVIDDVAFPAVSAVVLVAGNRIRPLVSVSAPAAR